ncbi:MAG TPA: single-stranded DNA-binding protein, partial [bacterium]|nr:single-stranded DNA-binding protein [bacterium]
IIGRLGKDPELRTTENGASLVNFNLAHNEIRLVNGTREQIAHWFRCTAFGSLAQLCAEYLSKGSRVGISGALRQHTWETSEGQKRSNVEILVRDIEFISTNNRSDSPEDAD